MKHFFPEISNSRKHKIDFSLIPLGVVLIEFSVFTTQLSKVTYRDLSGLIELRILHTLVMLVLAHLLAKAFIKLRKTSLDYRTIALTGTLVIALGDLFHAYLAPIFHVELIEADRRLGIIILQGCLWFPAFIIIGGKRTEIFQQFKAYEERLLVATRVRARNSDQFKDIQQEIQDQIRAELYELCNQLKKSISRVELRESELVENNAAIQALLAGEDLRRLSMRLETYGSEHSGRKFLGQNLNSVKLLIKQFQILYASTIRRAPLHPKTYTFILMALVTPPYINFFTLKETMASYPLLAACVYLSSCYIAKTQASQTPKALRNSSFLIFATGLLPLLFNTIGQQITQNPRTQYPIFLSALSLPVFYYIFIKVLQVLQPRALELIKNDELTASSALQDAVTGVVSDEFSHTLSHRWAIYIHGKILTILAATTLKLETACTAGDFKTFKESVQSLLTLLENPDADFEQTSMDLASEVSSRLDPWLGLLEITVQIDSELKSIKNARVRNVGEVIEELITNSMRHGKAQSINLRVTKKGEGNIQISAIDDAQIAPPEIPTRYGLGTRIFNLASDGRWSLTRVESGTEFELTMTLEI